MAEGTNKEPVDQGWYWCHIRKDHFRWDEAMAFWKTHDWDGNPIDANKTK